MNSRERLYARLAGKPVDKIPNMNIYMFIVAREAGVSYSEYVRNYKKLVEGNLICAEKYGADTVSAISDPMREASAYGAKVIFPRDNVPYAEENLIGDNFDLSVLNRFDPLESERTADRVNACALFRQKVCNDYPVVGWIEGGIAEAADLRGLDNIMMDLAGGEPYLDELFPLLFEQQKKFAKAQIDAGADIMGIGNAAASLVGPDLYARYGLPWDKKIIGYIHSLDARVKLHICGNITPLLEHLREAAPDILDIDWMVDFAKAVEVFRGSATAVSGNVDPVAVLMQGTPEFVREQVQHCIDAGAENTLIAAGCEVPAMTPDVNLKVMDQLLYVQGTGAVPRFSFGSFF